MCYIEESISTSDGLRLYLRKHAANEPRGNILLVHGFGEHSGRYRALIEHLVSHSYSVCAYDQRGHGQSDGLPGHVEHFGDYDLDLERIVASMRAADDERPLFIVAHSMGGLVALRYLARESTAIAGAVLSAPLLGVVVKVPAHKVMMARVSAVVSPRLRLDNEINPAVLSRDPEVGRAYAADPLVNRKVSARWFSEATAAIQEMPLIGASIITPLLVMHGTGDKLASVEATRRIFPLLASSDKELVVYDGFYHELFNEPEKDDIYAKVSAWIESRSHA
jgi:alpha-beta hydrolase superfamily lysophospholipase